MRDYSRSELTNAIDEWISPSSEPNKIVGKAITELVAEKAS